jgi:OFA family oxalate/formate antiporter-like MFS transporter
VAVADDVPALEIAERDAPAVTAAGARVYYGYWLLIGGIVAMFVSVGTQNYVGGVFLKPMTLDLGWSRTEFTLSRTIGQFVVAFAGFFIGTIVDRRGGRRLMFTGATVLCLALLGISRVTQLWQWIVLNGIVLTAGAVMAGNLVVNVTLSKWFVERRGRAIAFASMGVSFAGVAIPPAATAAVQAWGWRGAWVAIAILAAVLLYPVAAIQRRAPEDYGLFPDGKSREQIAAGGGHAAAVDFATSMTRAQAVRTATFYLIVIAFGFGGLSISVMLLQTIPFMTDAGYSRGVASLMIVLTSTPSLLSKPVWGYLLDRASPRAMAAFGFIVNAIALVLIVVTVRLRLDPAVYASFVLLGFGWGGFIPLQEVIWATYFGRRYLGAVRSAGMPVALILQAGGPLAASIYFDRVGDYNGAFLGVAALSAAAVVLVQFLRRPGRHAIAA